MLKFFEMLKGFFTQVISAEPLASPTREERQKKHKFIFPETLATYDAEYLRLTDQIESLRSVFYVLQAEIELIDAPVYFQDFLELLDKKIQSNEAREMLKRLHVQLSKLEDLLRHEERVQVFFDSTEICRTPVTSDLRTMGLCRDRVVVQWQGRIVLMQITISAFRSTMTIDWMTESMNQLRNEELQAVVRFQNPSDGK